MSSGGRRLRARPRGAARPRVTWLLRRATHWPDQCSEVDLEAWLDDVLLLVELRSGDWLAGVNVDGFAWWCAMAIPTEARAKRLAVRMAQRLVAGRVRA